jgi:branched-chain amino acid transport system substrate-binding protein
VDDILFDRLPKIQFSTQISPEEPRDVACHQAPCRRTVDSSLRHYFKAVAATNSVDPETLIAQMRKTPVDDFFAPGGKVRGDGRMVHEKYLMRITKPEESKQKWDLYEYLETVAGDDAFRPIAESGCPYLAKYG